MRTASACDARPAGAGEATGRARQRAVDRGRGSATWRYGFRLRVARPRDVDDEQARDPEGGPQHGTAAIGPALPAAAAEHRASRQSPITPGGRPGRAGVQTAPVTRGLRLPNVFS